MDTNISRFQKLKTGLMIIDGALMGYDFKDPFMCTNSENCDDLLILIDDCDEYTEEQIEETEKKVKQAFESHFRQLKELGFRYISGPDELNDDGYLLGFGFELS